MKLSKVAIMALRGSEKDFKEKLADSLDVHINTLYRYIVENNDDLTKAGALELIRQQTGLTDNELLERMELEAEKVAAEK